MTKSTLLFLSLAAVYLSAVSAQSACDTIDYTVFPAIDNFGVCSLQGTCTNNNTCDCKNLWTGRSDFLNTEGRDCQVNEIAIICLWSINILSTLYSVKVSTPKVRSRYEKYLQRKMEKLKQGKKETFQNNRGLVACMLLLFAGWPAMFTVAVLRIAKWDERVGVTFGMTFMFGMIKLFFYVTNWLYSPAVLTSMLKGTRYRDDRITQLVRLNEGFSFFLMCLSVVTGFAPFIALINEGELGSIEQLTYVLYFSGMLITMTGYLILFSYIKRNVISVLDESIKVTQNNSTIEIRDKLNKLFKNGQKQSGGQLVIYTLFLAWPYLWNKHDYFLPLSWLAFNSLGRDCCLATISDEGGTSKSGSSKGSKDSKEGVTTQQTFEFSRRELGPPSVTVEVEQNEEYI